VNFSAAVTSPTQSVTALWLVFIVYPLGVEAELALVVGQKPRWYTRLLTVTHPSSKVK